jgi:peptidyl-prolyl cis-trans isomerase C
MRTMGIPRVFPGFLDGARATAAGLGLCAAVLSWPAPCAALAAPPAAPAASSAAAGKRKAAVPSGSEVVARVNGDPILRRDFDLAVQIQFRGRRHPLGLQELQAVRDKVLERLIENELLHQKAIATATPVPDKDVDAEFKTMKEGYSSAEDFMSALKQNGVSEAEFKDQLRRTLLVTRFVEQEVAGDVKVSDEEVRRYYDQNPAEMNRKEAVHLAQILVRVSPDAPQESRATARQRIEEILKEVRAGGEFADLARRYSAGLDAKNGGDTGWMVRGKGPPAIEKSAFALAPGQTSDVVESRLGFHILKVLAKRAEGPVPFEEARDKIRARLVAREREAKIRAYVDQLKEQARVERGSKAAS